MWVGIIKINSGIPSFCIAILLIDDDEEEE